MLKVWSKRHRDLSRLRNQVACRLHAVLCDLVPGGHPKEITAAQAARILDRPRHQELLTGPAPSWPPSSSTTCAAWMPSSATPARSSPRRSGPPAPPCRGVRRRPGHRGTIIGDVADVSRFPGRDHFASYNGTAPVEVSSGNRKIHRLSLRGNRRINHAIHMAAITQIRHRHSDGRAYYEKKLAEGKTHKEALRALKRGSATPSCPPPGRRPPSRSATPWAREGNRGTTLHPARPAHTPHASSSGKPLPGPTPRLRPGTTTRHTFWPPIQPTGVPGQGWAFLDRCHSAPAKRQVQVERPERSEDERPGGAARRRPHLAARKAPVGTTSRKTRHPLDSTSKEDSLCTGTSLSVRSARASRTGNSGPSAKAVRARDHWCPEPVP